MESIHRLLPTFVAGKCLRTPKLSPFRLAPSLRLHSTAFATSKPGHSDPSPIFANRITRRSSSSSATSIARAGWLLGLGDKNPAFPPIVKAGDPVLHEPAEDVEREEIGSDRIQKIIDDMVKVMRKAPGVGLAAPQIGIPLRVSSNYDFCAYL